MAMADDDATCAANGDRPVGAVEAPPLDTIVVVGIVNAEARARVAAAVVPKHGARLASSPPQITTRQQQASERASEWRVAASSLLLLLLLPLRPFDGQRFSMIDVSLRARDDPAGERRLRWRWQRRRWRRWRPEGDLI